MDKRMNPPRSRYRERLNNNKKKKKKKNNNNNNDDDDDDDDNYNIALVWQCCESGASVFTFTSLMLVLDPPLCPLTNSTRPGTPLSASSLVHHSPFLLAVCLRVDLMRIII